MSVQYVTKRERKHSPNKEYYVDLKNTAGLNWYHTDRERLNQMREAYPQRVGSDWERDVSNYRKTKCQLMKIILMRKFWISFSLDYCSVSLMVLCKKTKTKSYQYFLKYSVRSNKWEWWKLNTTIHNDVEITFLHTYSNSLILIAH